MNSIANNIKKKADSVNIDNVLPDAIKNFMNDNGKEVKKIISGKIYDKIMSSDLDTLTDNQIVSCYNTSKVDAFNEITKKIDVKIYFPGIAMDDNKLKEIFRKKLLEKYIKG